MIKVSKDPFTNTTSFHRTQVEPDTFSFGSTIVGTFQSGRFSNGGSSDVGWSTSTDSGATWKHGFLPGTTVFANPPGPYDRDTDPAVAYDAAHGTWLINTLGMTGTTGAAILVNRSTDGGLTWGNPVIVAAAQGGQNLDKNWIACDNTPSSPFYGHCYVEWDDNGSGNLFHMAMSTNGGKTWAGSSVPGVSVIAGQPLVQPNGTVIVPIDNGFEGAVESFVSTNGGTSYTGPYSIATISAHGVAGNLRDPPLPSAEIDGSGKVYVVWFDCRFRSGCPSNDIVMSTSKNGTTWTPVARIPIDPINSTVDHFIPGIGVDVNTSGNNAHLGVTYYFYPDANCTTATCKLDVGFISSTDGGANWSQPTQLAGPMSLTGLPLTSQGYMVGDYISTSHSNGTAHPIFAKAKGSSCVLGQITSCNERMVSPLNGLTGSGPLIPIGHDRVVTHHSDHPTGGLKTAR